MMTLGISQLQTKIKVSGKPTQQHHTSCLKYESPKAVRKTDPETENKICSSTQENSVICMLINADLFLYSKFV